MLQWMATEPSALRRFTHSLVNSRFYGRMILHYNPKEIPDERMSKIKHKAIEE